ncbi:MAG: glycogen debranching enzyme, partial [Flavobacteriales bacterium]|nr:glycogen debranching enzyme [Flavobacteriales bacterium]
MTQNISQLSTADKTSPHITSVGSAAPLGATITGDGVNFSIYSNNAQAVELWLFHHGDDAVPYQIIRLDPEKNRSYHYWHVMVHGAGEGLYYGYKIYGEYAPSRGLYFDGSKLLSDPFSRGLYGAKYQRGDASMYGIDNTSTALKSMVVGRDNYDWEGDRPLGHSLSSSVIYEMHVGGFTSNPNSGVEESRRGKFLGVIDKIPYLKKIGITTVELMPVFAFDPQDAPLGLRNYW